MSLIAHLCTLDPHLRLPYFFFNDTATTEIYTLSLHDALPIFLTPHIAGSTHEAQEAIGYQIALQVKEYLKHGVIQNAVNVPSVSHDEYLEMQPYIVLAERLGAFLVEPS